MSIVNPIEASIAAERERYEQQGLDIEPEKVKVDEQKVTPEVQAASEQQDQKITVQGFQYTGKGSFIDKVF